MKAKILAGVVLSAGVLMASQSVFAQGYAGGSLGQTTASGGGGGSQSATGYKIFGGYQFMPALAAEVAYLDSGNFPGGGNVTGIAISAVGSLPVNPQITALGKVGMYNWSVVGASGSDLFFGLGGVYNVNNKLGIRAEYEMYKLSFTGGGSVNANVLSVGAQYKF